MIIKSKVEEIRKVFPTVLEAEIIKSLNIYQKDYVNETSYLEDYVELADIHLGMSWNLPSDYNRFKEILMYDTNGNPLYMEDFYMTYEIDYGILYFKTTDTNNITKLSDGIATVYLGYYKSPGELSTIGDSFSVNDDHIPGIMAKVYKEYYAKYPVDILVNKGVNAGEVIHNRDFNAVNFWATQEVDYRRKGKRWVNRKNDDGKHDVINYGMAGKFELPKRVDALSASSTLSISGTGYAGIYSKYVLFTVTTSSVTTTISPVGYGSVTASVAYNSSTGYYEVTVNGTFDNLTDYESNNKDIGLKSFATNQIVFNFPSGMGTHSLLIFDRITA